MGCLNLPWRVVPHHDGPHAETIDEYKIVDANGDDIFQDAGCYEVEGSVTRKEVADFIVRIANAQRQADMGGMMDNRDLGGCRCRDYGRDSSKCPVHGEG